MRTRRNARCRLIRRICSRTGFAGIVTAVVLLAGITRRIGKAFGRNQLVMSRRGEDPETVKVQLPTPFAGQASYRRGANALPSWTGNLNVDMPGATGVALAGVGFSAVLCRGKVASCRYGNASTSDP